MPSVALKPREIVIERDARRSVSDSKALHLIAQSRYQPPSVASFAIADTIQTGQLSMITNTGRGNT